jgi:hypothetical protein
VISVGSKSSPGKSCVEPYIRWSCFVPDLNRNACRDSISCRQRARCSAQQLLFFRQLVTTPQPFFEPDKFLHFFVLIATSRRVGAYTGLPEGRCATFVDQAKWAIDDSARLGRWSQLSSVDMPGQLLYTERRASALRQRPLDHFVERQP